MVVIDLCKFNASGTLERLACDLDETTYIAISHVWGVACWQKLSNTPFDVLASAQKAKWIQEELPKLVGETHFWMDVLAVDQSKKENRVKVVCHVPGIYRNALKTLVVREGRGFARCCLELLPAISVMHDDRNQDTSVAYSDALSASLQEHVLQHHTHGFSEACMERVWPLQEIILSKNLDFVLCDPSQENDTAVGFTSTSDRAFLVALTKFQKLASEIRQIAYFWGDEGQRLTKLDEEQQQQLEYRNINAFLTALFTNGAAEREADPTCTVKLSTPYHLLTDLCESDRRTGRAQDFILAIFPSCEWYRVPENVVQMSFQDLFVDLCKQMEAALADRTEDFKSSDGKLTMLDVFRIQPKIVNGVLKYSSTDAESSRLVTDQIPTPNTMAEFAKLFFLQHDERIGDIRTRSGWYVLKFQDYLAMPFEDFFEIVSHCLWTIDPEGLTNFTIATALETERSREHASDADATETASEAVQQPSDRISERNLPPDRAFIVYLYNLHVAIRTNAYRALQRQSREQFRKEGFTISLSNDKTVFSKLEETDSMELRISVMWYIAFLSTKLNLAALPWGRSLMAPYLLCAPRLNNKTFMTAGEPLPDYIVMLGPPDLDPTELAGVQISVRGDEPFVTACTKTDPTRKVIGLAPVFRDNLRPDGWVGLLIDGMPVALFVEDRDAEADKRQLARKFPELYRKAPSLLPSAMERMMLQMLGFKDDQLDNVQALLAEQALIDEDSAAK